MPTIAPELELSLLFYTSTCCLPDVFFGGYYYRCHGVNLNQLTPGGGRRVSVFSVLLWREREREKERERERERGRERERENQG